MEKQQQFTRKSFYLSLFMHNVVFNTCRAGAHLILDANQLQVTGKNKTPITETLQMNAIQNVLTSMMIYKQE